MRRSIPLCVLVLLVAIAGPACRGRRPPASEKQTTPQRAAGPGPVEVKPAAPIPSAPPAPAASVPSPVLTEEVFALDTPVPLPARPKVARGKCRVAFSWRKVQGANAYELQVARDIEFKEDVVVRRVKKPIVPKLDLVAAVYFWRVRALGKAGTSAYSGLRILDATASARPPGPKLKKREAPPADGAPLYWDEPREGAIVYQPAIELRGRPLEMVRLRVGLGDLIEQKTPFTIPATLNPGRNRVTLTVRTYLKLWSLERNVFYISPTLVARQPAQFAYWTRRLDDNLRLKEELEPIIDRLEASAASGAEKGEAASESGQLDYLKATRARAAVAYQEALRSLEQLLL